MRDDHFRTQHLITKTEIKPEGREIKLKTAATGRRKGRKVILQSNGVAELS